MRMGAQSQKELSSLSEPPFFPLGPGSPTLEVHTDRSSDLALLLVLLRRRFSL